MFENSPKKHAGESLVSDSSDSKENVHVGTEPALENYRLNEFVVSAREVIDGMLEDASVILKVFFVPSGVSRIPSKHSSRGTFDLFELTVLPSALLAHLHKKVENLFH